MDGVPSLQLQELMWKCKKKSGFVN